MERDSRGRRTDMCTAGLQCIYGDIFGSILGVCLGWEGLECWDITGIFLKIIYQKTVFIANVILRSSG